MILAAEAFFFNFFYFLPERSRQGETKQSRQELAHGWERVSATHVGNWQNKAMTYDRSYGAGQYGWIAPTLNVPADKCLHKLLPLALNQGSGDRDGGRMDHSSPPSVLIRPLCDLPTEADDWCVFRPHGSPWQL